jgi:hypothetical protein
MCNRSSRLLCQSLPCARQELSAAHAELLDGAVAKFQGVTGVMIMDDFPRIVEGKTLKRVLGEQYKRAEEEAPLIFS